jgi:hypothetical protein
MTGERQPARLKYLNQQIRYLEGMSRRSIVPLLLALGSAGVVVGFTVSQVPDGTAFAAALGLIPVPVYVAATLRPSILRITVLTVILVAYTIVWADGTLVYDTTSTGSLVFIFLPFYGVIALVLGLVIPSVTKLARLVADASRGLFRSP